MSDPAKQSHVKTCLSDAGVVVVDEVIDEVKEDMVSAVVEVVVVDGSTHHSSLEPSDYSSANLPQTTSLENPTRYMFKVVAELKASYPTRMSY